MTDADQFIGSLLEGRFRIDSMLGHGGMSVVYKAHFIPMDKPVAIKVMRNHLSSEHGLQRFKREARALCQIKHENLVDVYQLGVMEDGSPFMVIEYLQGESLAARILRDGAQDVKWTCRRMIEICGALSAVHEQGVLHRDIKPGNIMIVPQPDGMHKAKLVDFGIAKIGDAESGAQLTQAGSLLGSPAYMSPEQCKGLPADERSEIYAVGCVMFEMLTGLPPFQSDSMIEVLSMQTSKEVAIPSSANVPQNLSNVVLRCLQKNPADRYASAEELAADLQSVLRDEPVLSTAPPKNLSNAPKALWEIANSVPKRLRRIFAGLALALGFATGVAFSQVPVWRAEVLEALLPLAPGGAALWVQDQLVSALNESKDPRAQNRAAEIEEARGHYMKAARLFTAAQFHAGALRCLKKEIDRLGPEQSEAKWNARIDHLKALWDSNPVGASPEGDAVMFAFYEDLVRASNEDDAPIYLVSVHKRFWDEFVRPYASRHNNHQLLLEELIYQAERPYRLRGDNAGAAANLRRLVDSPFFQRIPFANQVLVYRSLFDRTVRKGRPEETIAVAREYKARFKGNRLVRIEGTTWEAQGLIASKDPRNAINILLAVEKDVEAEPQKVFNGAHYQVLVNAYADAGQFANCLKVARKCRERGMASQYIQLQEVRAEAALGHDLRAEMLLNNLLTSAVRGKTKLLKIGFWYHELSSIQKRLGEREKQKQSLDLAMKYASTQAEPRDKAEWAALYNIALDLAEIRRQENDLNGVLALWLEQNRLQSMSRDADPITVANTYVRIACAQRELGRYADQLTNLKRAHAIRRVVEPDSPRTLAVCKEIDQLIRIAEQNKPAKDSSGDALKQSAK